MPSEPWELSKSQAKHVRNDTLGASRHAFGTPRMSKSPGKHVWNDTLGVGKLCFWKSELPKSSVKYVWNDTWGGLRISLPKVRILKILGKTRVE